MIAESNFVANGYKQTELGVLTDDWIPISIQSLIDSHAIVDHLDGNHGALYPRSHEFQDYGVPYVTANDFLDGRVQIDGCKCLSAERARLFRKGVAKSGDVLFAHNATVGPTAILETRLDFVILSTTATYFRCDPSRINNVFFHYALQAPFFVRQYQAVMAQSTRNQVPITAQRKLSVVIPETLAEQEAIAEALGDADALIESLEQLVAKKRHLKQAAMQQLLTGKERLPGFDGEWKLRPLRDCLLALPDYGINAPGVEFDGSLPSYLRITDIDDDGRIYDNKRVAVDHPSSQDYILGPNDIVFARTGASVGKTYLYRLSDGPLVFAGFLIRAQVDPTKLSPAFLFNYTHTRPYWNWVRVMSMRSGQPGINGNEYASLELPLPPTVDEQAEIAAILTDMDTEIEVLEAKLSKARQIKQGMMQELLTGRIRLV